MFDPHQSPEDAARWGAFVTAVARLAGQSGYEAAIVAGVNFAPGYTGCSVASGLTCAPGVPSEALRLAGHVLAHRLTATEAAPTPIATA
jgi:hypothetical protein